MKSFIAAILTVFLVGCATVTGEGAKQVAAKTTIQFATLKVIDQDQARANRVVTIVSDVKQFVDGNAALNDIEAQVRDEIDWSRLDEAETLVVSNLIDAVRVEIEARVDEGVLDGNDRVAVKNVLDWIHEAAVMAGGTNGTQTAIG